MLAVHSPEWHGPHPAGSPARSWGSGQGGQRWPAVGGASSRGPQVALLSRLSWNLLRVQLQAGGACPAHGDRALPAVARASSSVTDTDRLSERGRRGWEG